MLDRLKRAWHSFNLKPKPPLDPEARELIQAQSRLLDEAQAREQYYRADYMERAMELVEARQMAGAGPWLVAESRADLDKSTLRESNPITSAGAYGDIELALQNVEWRREVNLSWLEFSRWGIQQIILISRLYYIKNPIVRRLIDISAYYVFGRGVEVSCDDEAANEVLQDFFERNKSTLGQIALVELEKRKYYDGNLFFAFFTDTDNKGDVNVRTIDATEIQDIVTDPEDSDKPRYYRREWTQRNFDMATGSTKTTVQKAYYPALGYEPAKGEDKPPTINSIEVRWDTPVLHRRCGGVAKWLFGCPIIYPAIDWAKASKKFLEHCATVKAALAQIAMKITTKGGQQAIEGVKQQMSTTIGPSQALWDMDPSATAGSVFASGPGTSLDVFNTKGGGGDPEEVRQFKLMCCIVVGVPETFLGDVKTGNLATATSLDRPTELCFMEKQESWREDLVTIAQFVIKASSRAGNGAVRAALRSSGIDPAAVKIIECKRVRTKAGKWAYEKADPSSAKPDTLKIKATFPAIREGDIPELIKSAVSAMTLDNKGGQVVGIDAKVGVGKLYELLDIEDGDEILEEMYPDGEYERDRTKEDLTPPIPKLQDRPGGPVDPAAPPAKATVTQEHRRLAAACVAEAIASNGVHSH